MDVPGEGAGGGGPGDGTAVGSSRTYAHWKRWRDGHSWLSRPFVCVGGRFRLPPAWRRAPTTGVGRLVDHSIPVFLIVFLVSLVVGVVEPFGLGNASKARSMRVSARVMAPFYTAKARDSIAVVLIDDIALQATGQGWPLAYAEYERLLRQVLEHRPRAVYLDVLLLDRRGYDGSFEDAHRDIHETVRASGIPVYFGVGAPGAVSLFSQPGGVRDVVTSWQGTGGAYPLRLDRDQVNEAAGAVAGGVQGLPSWQPTVAFALYQHACPTADAPGCTRAAACFPEHVARDPMVVQWGWRPGATGHAGPMLCEDPQEARARSTPSPSIAQRLAAMASLTWQSFRSGADPTAEDLGRSQCMYTPTLFADALTDSSLLRQDEDTPALLEDRIVLIGTHLLGLDDSVQSPVNQRVPGVYLHAMALDNLMRWGEDRVHESPALGRLLGLLNAIVMSLVAGWALLRRGARPVTLAWLAGVAGTLAAAGLAQVLLAQWILRQPPQDWIGMGLTAIAVMYLVSRRGDDIG